MSTLAPSIRKRHTIERRIVDALVKAALAKGYSLSVFDGEEDSKLSDDYSNIHNALYRTDEDHLNVYNSHLRHLATFRLIYGNDGWDVIADYSANWVAEDLYQAIGPLIRRYER
jgi:hypothetical protein